MQLSYIRDNISAIREKLQCTNPVVIYYNLSYISKHEYGGASDRRKANLVGQFGKCKSKSSWKDSGCIYHDRIIVNYLVHIIF